MKTITTFAKLVAQETDSFNYTTYVFKLLDDDECDRLETKYIMCVRWPNWDHRELFISDEGYLSINLIEAGIDKWYDGSTFIPYKYTNIQFNKFLDKVEDKHYEFKM